MNEESVVVTDVQTNAIEYDRRKDKVRGCLIGQAVGDALGFTSENLSRERIRKKFGRITEYHVRPRAAFFTDDTQLATMVAETLAECGGYNDEVFRKKLARWRLVVPRLSGRSTKYAALKCLLGLKDTGYDVPGSSGAMRIAPIGLRYFVNEDELRSRTIECCQVTHTNASAIAGALVTSFSVAYAMTDETFDLPRYLSIISTEAGRFDMDLEKRLRSLPDLLEIPEETALKELLRNSSMTGSPIGDIVATAIYAFIKYHADFSASVQFCVNAGWDTDTMAAINGAICGAWNGLSAIPSRYIDNLENGYKGRDHILNLADRIYRKDFGATRTNPLIDLLLDYGHNTALLSHMFLSKPMV